MQPRMAVNFARREHEALGDYFVFNFWFCSVIQLYATQVWASQENLYKCQKV